MSDELIKIDPQFADALAAAGIRVNQIRRRTLLQIHAILFSQYCRTYWRAPSYELTTGTDVFDVVTHDAAACWVCTPPPPPRCTCPYSLHVAHLPYQVNRTTVRRRTVVLGSYFTIDPFCLHHGDIAIDDDRDAFTDRPYEVVLDEDERRGH